MMRKLQVASLGVAVLLPISLVAQTRSDGDLTEEKISARIFRMPEVVAVARYVDSLSKGTRHLSTWIYDRPSRKSKYYRVKVVEDNGVSLFTHFNFLVTGDTILAIRQDEK